jgi:hypothetical protein
VGEDAVEVAGLKPMQAAIERKKRLRKLAEVALPTKREPAEQLISD